VQENGDWLSLTVRPCRPIPHETYAGQAHPATAIRRGASPLFRRRSHGWGETAGNLEIAVGRAELHSRLRGCGRRRRTGKEAWGRKRGGSDWQKAVPL
jgi:hypothetical protein